MKKAGKRSSAAPPGKVKCLNGDIDVIVRNVPPSLTQERAVEAAITDVLRQLRVPLLETGGLIFVWHQCLDDEGAAVERHFRIDVRELAALLTWELARL